MIKLLNSLYEYRLTRQIRGGSVPAHVGIILDVNRQHGRQCGVEDTHTVYSLGARKFNEVLDWCVSFEIPAVIFRVLSTENLYRPISAADWWKIFAYQPYPRWIS